MAVSSAIHLAILHSNSSLAGKYKLSLYTTLEYATHNKLKEIVYLNIKEMSTCIPTLKLNGSMGIVLPKTVKKSRQAAKKRKELNSNKTFICRLLKKKSFINS